MTLELTKRERTKLSRIANKLYRDGVSDEHKAIAFYKRVSGELERIGLHKEADYIRRMIKSKELHKDILNEIIQDINEKVIVSQFKGEVTLKGDRPFIGRLSRR